MLQLRHGRQLILNIRRFCFNLRLRFLLCPPFLTEQAVEAFKQPMGAVVDADLVCQLDKILQLLPQLCVLTGKQPVRHRLRRWSVRAVGNVQPPAQERRVVGGEGQRVGAGGRDGDKLIFRVLGKLDAALLANLRKMLFHVGDDAVCGFADGVQTGAELRQLGVFRPCCHIAEAVRAGFNAEVGTDHEGDAFGLHFFCIAALMLALRRLLQAVIMELGVGDLMGGGGYRLHLAHALPQRDALGFRAEIAVHIRRQRLELHRHGRGPAQRLHERLIILHAAGQVGDRAGHALR